MLTYSEVLELVLQGELQAAVNLLLAHRLVSSVEVQGDVTARLTPFGVQLAITQPGCDRFLDISANEDGSPAVDVFAEQNPFDLTDMDIAISDAFDADRDFYESMGYFLATGMSEPEAYLAAMEAMQVPF